MPELGEVLSGILAEVVRARVSADTLTAQLVDAYRADATLTMLSVPRVTVREMSVTLRFAMTALELAAPSPADADRDAEAWSRVLKDRVLRRVARPRLAEVDPEERAEIDERLGEEPPVILEDRVQRALTGDSEPLVEESVAEVVNRFRAVPMRLRRRIGTIPELRADVEREVRSELDAFLARQRDLDQARKAHRSRVQVEVTADALQARTAKEIHELTLTLAMEDVETALAEASLAQGLGG